MSSAKYYHNATYLFTTHLFSLNAQHNPIIVKYL